jgi:hypothetical protein
VYAVHSYTPTTQSNILTNAHKDASSREHVTVEIDLAMSAFANVRFMHETKKHAREKEFKTIQVRNADWKLILCQARLCPFTLTGE